MNATVRFAGAGFEIRNNDTYRWNDCDLDLNSDYSITGRGIEPGDSITLPARAFVRRDGTRFDFRSTKPVTLFIYCRETPFGNRSTLVGWH